jgi:hypothetical protein
MRKGGERLIVVVRRCCFGSLKMRIVEVGWVVGL